MIACLSAVFAMRSDTNETLSFGSYRILGNLLGGAFALVYYFIAHNYQDQFYLELILVPLLVIVLIVAADAIGLNAGIVGATSTLLVIVLTVPANQTFFFALNRILDTIIGTVIALGVNHFIKPQKVQAVDPVVELEQTIATQQVEIDKLKQQLADKEKA